MPAGLVIVHGETSRAARLTDGETSLGENLVEPLLTDLLIDEPRAGDEPSDNIGVLLAALYNRRECAEILNAAIGAGVRNT